MQAGGLLFSGKAGTECSAPFRSVCGLCQNGYHSPPAGRRFHTGHSAGIVLCNDPQLQGDHCTAAAGLQTGGILRRRDLQCRRDPSHPGCIRLSEKELIVPEFARYEAALGAALKASGSFTLRQLNDSLDRTLTTHHMVGTLPKLELRPGTSLAEPNATKIIPESGCALGIDIGSTSTDLVLVGADGDW